MLTLYFAKFLRKYGFLGNNRIITVGRDCGRESHRHHSPGGVGRQAPLEASDEIS
jgi:hypothetical protein